MKPENIMLVYDEIKIVDFGCACVSPYGTESMICGTIDYIPPEMVNQEFYGTAVDIWSFGICVQCSLVVVLLENQIFFLNFIYFVVKK